MVHSFAFVIARSRVFQGDKLFGVENINLFLAVQIAHKIQDANWFEVILVGRRHCIVFKIFHHLTKLVKVDISMDVSSGASFQTY